ncbi:acyl-CoA dehydrogenase [Pochonia chlamydosporia 170]|uniref:Acyl-CoA dehydrogenase n=1 Tax=Pochonia chlamydosporia 170 TaxID=1380566 RepID=A0A219AS11_METCM|nr:acyl-CoA dehydrogenase [Pochonia chlamydosporia 170]OWT43551.1 acyl-CoA dehydrogenase [Pochonia chlamydosporia 170]
METTGFTENQLLVRESINQICSQFPSSYWQEHDQNEQDPKEFHAAIAKGGWLGIALPESLGGAGLGISEATMMMQTITESGAGMAGAQAIHANVYATQPLAKFGTEEQLAETIPNIISGKWRTCFGVTEPNAGLNTLALSTTAQKTSDGYSITGQKIWITCAQVASKMILLARTTPRDQVKKPSEGLSLFCIDLDRDRPGLELRRIKKMGGRAVDANEVFFDNYDIPSSALIGEEGRGFKMILHGMNAERCLLAGEALGLGYAALSKAASYARERVVFERPIGMNQGVAHPLADAYVKLEAAKLATYHAARLYDQSKHDGNVKQDAVGVAANSAKYVAAEAAFTACERAVLAHGGMGYPRRSRRLEPAPAPEASVSLSPARTVDTNVRPSSSIAGGDSYLPDAEPRSSPPVHDDITADDNHATTSAPSAPGTLFFGESNFLTLVPGNEAAALGGTGNTPNQKPRLTFPIPGSPGSQSQVEGAGISASTMRYLRDEGALTLPDLQTCLPALQAYFTWFHPSFPILDRAEVTRRLAAMDISRFLLQAVLFIGATYCDDATILDMGFTDRSEAKRVLYTRARLLFHADWEKDEMILIQSIFLMSFWRGGPADVRDVRYWLGVVITLSESYGLHRSPRSISKGTHMNRMRRRIWWSIYVRERQVAAALGLPSRIRDEDCDIEPLSATDLESEALSANNQLFGSCQPEHITYTIKMVEIARLLGRVIDLHFAPGKRASTAGDVQDLDNALEAWKDSLPDSMKYATDEGSESVWTCLLHLAYNHLRILIHRNSFLRHGEGDKNNQVTAAACRISRIAEDMSTHGTLRYGQMHLITSLFAALCIHVISIRRGMGVSRRIAEHRAQMCLLCLKEIQKYWRINNNVLDLFLQYLDRSIAERLHAAQTDGSGADAAAGSKRQDPFVGSNGDAAGDAARGDPMLSQTAEQQRSQDELFQDQYFNLVNGHWEGDDALGDLGLFLQADDFSPVKGLNFLGRSL